MSRGHTGTSAHYAAAPGCPLRRAGHGVVGEEAVAVCRAALWESDVHRAHRPGPALRPPHRAVEGADRGRAGRGGPLRASGGGRAGGVLADGDAPADQGAGRPGGPGCGPTGVGALPGDRRAPVPVGALVPRREAGVAAGRAVDDDVHEPGHRACHRRGRRPRLRRGQDVAEDPAAVVAPPGSRGGDRSLSGVPLRGADPAAQGEGVRGSLPPGQARQRHGHPGATARVLGSARPARTGHRPDLGQPAAADARLRHPLRTRPSQAENRPRDR